MGCEMLERSAVKVARSVLRRGHRSNSMSLFDPPHIVTYREPASIGYVSNITIWGLPVIHKEIEPSKELGLALIP
jgi:hypothetical protein